MRTGGRIRRDPQFDGLWPEMNHMHISPIPSVRSLAPTLSFWLGETASLLTTSGGASTEPLRNPPVADCAENCAGLRCWPLPARRLSSARRTNAGQRMARNKQDLLAKEEDGPTRQP